ncbi:hypothetical protein N0V88_000787 [Collariella sp. IMI 366227]|nr:hypothetical protein N0V88_000787 [Collariella sp. IMI 366227]
MTGDIKHLDAHEQPSDELRAKWKGFSRAEPKDLFSGRDIDDLHNPESAAEFCIAGTIPVDTLNRSFQHICPANTPEFQATKDAPIYYHPLLPVLERKLHWVTLGGQYDWTARVYPEGEAPPAFPPDIATFLETLFPETKAQAAIVNFYTPGDTMMMHRDVSEETDRGLKKEYLVLRLKSGDAIYMTKESRFAWHGVPKVMKGTCPEYLEDWPADGGEYEEWKGWMRNKRINLNVRQMKD